MNPSRPSFSAWVVAGGFSCVAPGTEAFAAGGASGAVTVQSGAVSMPASPATAADAASAAGNDGPAYGPELEGFTYPVPVHRFDFTSQGEALHMAYLDVQPEQ